ncbi:hypothetical protein ACJX0J_041745, partial [Zea mays]
LSDPLQYQSIVDAEWNIIYDKLDKCVKSGAKIVLSRLAIGDLATQYFADRDILCARRVTEEDLQRVAAATGGTVVDLSSKNWGILKDIESDDEDLDDEVDDGAEDEDLCLYYTESFYKEWEFMANI